MRPHVEDIYRLHVYTVAVWSMRKLGKKETQKEAQDEEATRKERRSTGEHEDEKEETKEVFVV